VKDEGLRGPPGTSINAGNREKKEECQRGGGGNTDDSDTPNETAPVLVSFQEEETLKSYSLLKSGEKSGWAAGGGMFGTFGGVYRGEETQIDIDLNASCKKGGGRGGSGSLFKNEEGRNPDTREGTPKKKRDFICQARSRGKLIGSL